MLELISHGVYYSGGKLVDTVAESASAAREKTIAYGIMRSHSRSTDPEKMQIVFDRLISHDITYVGIIQTARASGLTEFPVPYALTNCHNSLCAVGGTINEDDHVFGLSAAKKYGGIYVPANLAVIHSYAREALSGCGKMVLGSDSHTRYGALGTMGIGEGGPEIVKQLLKNTYDIPSPEVIAVYLTGTPKKGVGPHDVAIALVGATFKNGFAKNKILEFIGPGVSNLSVDFRMGVDVMTTETTCLSSIWPTDDKVKEYYGIHGRPEEFSPLSPGEGAYYDGAVIIDLDKIEPMIALPFHPSNAYTIKEFIASAPDILAGIEKEAAEQFGKKVSFQMKDKINAGGVFVDQGVIAGCAGGTFESISRAAAILDGASTGDSYFNLTVYPGSMPINMALLNNNSLQKLMGAGAVIKPAFCGPCFGAGDVPANNALSVRHTTRNFPNREGSKPGDGQLSGVALMDALSIAATAKNGGRLTPATEVDYTEPDLTYKFDKSAYDKRIYSGFGSPQKDVELKFGPNIADWPKMYPLAENMLVKLAAVLRDDVTTTDELIPSGETSSFRSNPLRLAEFTLSRREPEYVARAKAAAEIEKSRRDGNVDSEIAEVLSLLSADAKNTSFGSAIFANKPGDGSAREQAASCQKVLGGHANIAYEYATKRYRSNCINWGILPFTIEQNFEGETGDFVFIPNIRNAIENAIAEIPAKLVSNGKTKDITLFVKGLTENEKQIILDGCLINYYAAGRK